MSDYLICLLWDLVPLFATWRYYLSKLINFVRGKIIKHYLVICNNVQEFMYFFGKNLITKSDLL